MSPRPSLIGLPYDAGSSFLRGAADAPPLIRAALRSPAGNSWTEGMRDLDGPGGLADAGDLQIEEGEGGRAQIEAAIAALLKDGFRPLVLGGDHSITYPVIRAMRRVHEGLTVLHIDAHPDLYDDFEGDRFSHACPFARVMEEGLAARLISVGIRAMNGRQHDQAARFGVEVIGMSAWVAGARPRVDGPVYVSMDLDGLDPSCAPGVSHREPGGLTTREAIALIHAVSGDVVGGDVVEYNPRQDIAGMTATVAAKIVKELAGRMMP